MFHDVQAARFCRNLHCGVALSSSCCWTIGRHYKQGQGGKQNGKGGGQKGHVPPVMCLEGEGLQIRRSTCSSLTGVTAASLLSEGAAADSCWKVDSAFFFFQAADFSQWFRVKSADWLCPITHRVLCLQTHITLCAVNRDLAVSSPWKAERINSQIRK